MQAVKRVMSEEFEILVLSETCHGHGNSIKAVTRQCIATKTQGARSHLVSLEVIRISFTMKNIILLDAINLKLLWIFQGMEAKTRFGEVTINILDI